MHSLPSIFNKIIANIMMQLRMEMSKHKNKQDYADTSLRKRTLTELTQGSLVKAPDVHRFVSLKTPPLRT
jgi:hypothetical protein